MPQYAKDTSVSSDQSLLEIKRTVERYGASGFAHAYDTLNGQRIELIEFKLRDRRMRFLLKLPDPKSKEFWYTPARRHLRTREQAHVAWEQSVRQRWRALALTIKAKLESVEAGIESIDEAFMPQLVTPSGQTIGQWAVPQIQVMYEHGTMPPLLPMLEG